MGIRRLTTSTLDTTSSDFKDPVIHINSNASGENTTDTGILLDRGSLGNVGILWDESADEFVLIETSAGGTADGNLTIDAYANLSINKLSIANATLDFPTADGANGQVLTTDGNGNLSFTTVSGGSGADLTGNLDFGTDANNTITFNGLVDSDIIPSANVTYNLGNATNRWQDLFLSGSTIDLGGAKIQTDTDSGAVAILPKPTANVANPKGIVFAGDGTVKPVTTTAGNVSQEEFSAAATSTATAPGVAVYANVADMPVANVTAGSQAFVTSNNNLYIHSGSGWFVIATVNQTPTISGNDARYILSIDGTPTVITLTGTDPEGFAITWTYETSGLGNIATVSNEDNVFTITPSTDSADQGEFTVTFKASDGVNIGTANSDFILTFASALWKDVVLSVGSSATNSLDNSTFIDRSTNTNTITPTGAPVQTAFHPYLNNWSVKFDGTNGDYLRCDEALDSFTATSDVFTIEAWLYPTVAGDASAAPDDYFFGLNRISDGNNQLIVGMQNIYYAGDPYDLNNIIETHKWTHLAVVFDGTDLKIYTDGVLNTTVTDTVEAPLQDLTFSMGAEFDSSSLTPGNYYSGYMSNVRVSDIVRYTTTFDPPTSAFIDDENTTFIGCQSNRFIDTSSNENTIVVVDAPEVTSFNSFGQESEYAVGENKGSVLFPSTSDYIFIGGHTISGDFCFKFWTYIFDDSIENWWVDSAGTRFLIYGDVDGSTLEVLGALSDTDNVTKNQWSYIEVSRSSGVIYLFQNGKLLGAVANTTNYSGNFFLAHNTGGGTNTVDGYISDFYFSNGTAGHTASYTPPTSPVGNTDATIYLPFDNAGIFDKTGLNTLTVVGDTSTSTTQVKYSDTSMYFDGSGDYLSVPDSENNRLGLGQFTIEAWVYPISYNGQAKALVSKGTGGTNGFYFHIFPDGALKFIYGTTSFFESSASIATGSWTHVAVVREGTGTNETKLYINGTQDGQGTVNYDFNQSNILRIGTDRGNNTVSHWNGYIENLQILKGVAKYTANFTPPNRTQGITYQAES